MTTPMVSSRERDLGAFRSPREYLRIARRWWIVIVISLVGSILLSLLILLQLPVLYRASAQMLVLREGNRPLQTTSSNFDLLDTAKEFAATQSMILTSREVVNATLHQVGFEAMPRLIEVEERGEDPVDFVIRNSLTVSQPDQHANVLEVRCLSESPEGAVSFANVLTEEYQIFLDKYYATQSGNYLKLLTRAREQLAKEVEQAEQAYLDYCRDNLVLEGEIANELITSEIEQWDSVLNELQIRGLQLDSQIALGSKLVESGVSFTTLAHALNQLGQAAPGRVISELQQSSTEFTSDRLRQLIAEQQELSAVQGGEGTGVRYLEEEIRQTRDMAFQSRALLDEGEIRNFLSAISASRDSIETLRQELSNSFEDEQRDIARRVSEQVQEANLRAEMDRKRELYQTVIEQLSQAEYSAEHTTINAEVIAFPQIPVRPISPRSNLILAGACLFGLSLGIALALTADALDSRVSTIESLSEHCNARILGTIPFIEKRRSVAIGKLGLLCQSAPGSLEAEAYKALRTNLELARRDRRSLSVLVSSPTPASGKSTTSSNLAISLAQAGRRVLLVDADLRKPSLNSFFEQPNDQGLAQILRDGVTLGQVVRGTQMANLDLITTGPIPGQPSELLMSPRLREFLDETRRDYDIVIVDSPPLLPVTDAQLLGARVDASVLVFSMQTVRRMEIKRSLELLQAGGAELFGVVVNAVNRKQGHVDHDSAYGYGYSYGGYGRTQDDHTDSTIDKSSVKDLVNTCNDLRSLAADDGGLNELSLHRDRLEHPALPIHDPGIEAPPVEYGRANGDDILSDSGQTDDQSVMSRSTDRD